tara:strand:- start:89 stop:364 length:276 start_codon:yes stop_codon:yes gene_type:complete
MTKQNELIFEDIIEKLELFERKMNILEDLINDLRLNCENKKSSIFEIKCISEKKCIIEKKTLKKKRRKKKKIKLPFNNFVIDTEEEGTESE